MAMARTPAYWTNKKCLPSLHAVSQLSLSQAPHSFGTSYRGFPAFPVPSNCLKTAKLRRLVSLDQLNFKTNDLVIKDYLNVLKLFPDACGYRWHGWKWIES